MLSDDHPSADGGGSGQEARGLYINDATDHIGRCPYSGQVQLKIPRVTLERVTARDATSLDDEQLKVLLMEESAAVLMDEVGDEARAVRRLTKILATARDLITKHGYEGVTMRELAVRGRCAPGIGP